MTFQKMSKKENTNIANDFFCLNNKKAVYKTVTFIQKCKQLQNKLAMSFLYKK